MCGLHALFLRFFLFLYKFIIIPFRTDLLRWKGWKEWGPRLWRVAVWRVHEVMHLLWIVYDANLAFALGPLSTTSYYRVTLSYLLWVGLADMSLEVLIVNFVVIRWWKRDYVEAAHTVYPHILGVSEGVAWLIQATAILDTVLVGDVVNLWGNFVEIFFGPPCLQHFLVPTEGPLLYCLLNVLNFETHLRLIGR